MGLAGSKRWESDCFAYGEKMEGQFGAVSLYEQMGTQICFYIFHLIPCPATSVSLLMDPDELGIQPEIAVASCGSQYAAQTRRRRSAMLRLFTTSTEGEHG